MNLIQYDKRVSTCQASKCQNI